MDTILRRQITCINKIDHTNPYERIQGIGGKENSEPWEMPVKDAIEAIANKKYSFFVDVGGKEVEIIVVKRNGERYLRTTPDDETKNNLLSLKKCHPLWD